MYVLYHKCKRLSIHNSEVRILCTYGLSAYNFLKGVPLEITTHNFGSVDSIGVVLYCAGARRLSVPHARFLIHGVSVNIMQPVSFEEKQVEELLKGLQIDIGNLARVIAATTGKESHDVIKLMLDRTTYYPEEAQAQGLVHEIKSEMFEPGAEVYNIQLVPQPIPESTQTQAFGGLGSIESFSGNT